MEKCLKKQDIKKTKERNSNIELLRCVVMVMVIALHYNDIGMGSALKYVTHNSLGYYLLYLVQSLSIPSVNCFILISGYFDCKRNARVIKKPILLILAVIGYNLIFYTFGVLTGLYYFSLKALIRHCIPANYYVILYCTLYLVSPYINLTIQKLSHRQFFKMLVLFIILFSLWPTITDTVFGIVGTKAITGISTISAINGADAGYTIVNFILMYLMGGYISKYFNSEKSATYYFRLYIILALVVFGISILSQASWNYCNIFVIFEATLLFITFLKLNLGSMKIINTVAKTTFGIYLVHTNGIMITYFWKMFNISKFVSESLMSLFINLLISVLSTPNY